MQKNEKQTFVSEISNAVSQSSAIFVTQQSGLTVAEVTDLRRQVKGVGASIKVAKNTLVKIALEGTQYSFLQDHFTGPTAMTFANDPVAVAKILVKFATGNEKLKVIAGAIGANKLNASEIERLSQLPSLDEIRATLVALIVTPATRIARIAAEPASRVARVVGAYSRSQN